MIARIVGCALCSRRELATGAIVCGRCRHELAPTRVRIALDALGMTALEAAEAAGVSRSTVMTALAGVPVRGAKGVALAQVLQLDPVVLLEGDPVPEELRAEAG